MWPGCYVCNANGKPVFAESFPIHGARVNPYALLDLLFKGTTQSTVSVPVRILLLLVGHRFSLAEHTGQHKGGLFFLLIGIQLLIAAAFISEHREDRAPKSSMATENDEPKEARTGAVNESVEQGKKS